MWGGSKQLFHRSYGEPAYRCLCWGSVKASGLEGVPPVDWNGLFSLPRLYRPLRCRGLDLRPTPEPSMRHNCPIQTNFPL